MLSKDQPLWLPKGSVRSLLALAVTLTVCAMALVGTITAEAFLAIASAVVAFYFGNRGANKQESPTPDA